MGMPLQGRAQLSWVVGQAAGEGVQSALQMARLGDGNPLTEGGSSWA